MLHKPPDTTPEKHPKAKSIIYSSKTCLGVSITLPLPIFSFNIRPNLVRNAANSRIIITPSPKNTRLAQNISFTWTARLSQYISSIVLWFSMDDTNKVSRRFLFLKKEQVTESSSKYGQWFPCCRSIFPVNKSESLLFHTFVYQICNQLGMSMLHTNHNQFI